MDKFNETRFKNDLQSKNIFFYKNDINNNLTIYVITFIYDFIVNYKISQNEVETTIKRIETEIKIEKQDSKNYQYIEKVNTVLYMEENELNELIKNIEQDKELVSFNCLMMLWESSARMCLNMNFDSNILDDIFKLIIYKIKSYTYAEKLKNSLYTNFFSYCIYTSSNKKYFNDNEEKIMNYEFQISKEIEQFAKKSNDNYLKYEIAETEIDKFKNNCILLSSSNLITPSETLELVNLDNILIELENCKIQELFDLNHSFGVLVEHRSKIEKVYIKSLEDFAENVNKLITEISSQKNRSYRLKSIVVTIEKIIK